MDNGHIYGYTYIHIHIPLLPHPLFHRLKTVTKLRYKTNIPIHYFHSAQ